MHFCWDGAQISTAIKELQNAQSIWATKIDFDWGQDDIAYMYAVWEILESDDEYRERLAEEKRHSEYKEEVERKQLEELKAKYES